MLKRLAAWLLVALAVGGISAALYWYKLNEIRAAEAAAQASPEPMEAVATVQARQGTWSATTRAIGTVVAQHQLEIRNETAGTIAKIGFKSGDVVDKGQMLIEFDTRQEEAALAASQADVRLAKLTLDRKAALKSSPAYSAQELDKSREEHAAAEARAKNLAVAIDKKKIAAPFKARVGITNLQPGAYLDVGTLIVRLQGVDDDAFVDFSLPQDTAAILHPGSQVQLSAPGLSGDAATAKIVAEDDSVDATNRMVRFRAVVSKLGGVLRPGTFVDITAVTSAPRETVFVPLSAVRRSTNGEHVFVIVEADGKTRAKQRTVATGAVQDNEIAIEKGLQAGETIAASGSFKLRDGVAVTPERKDASAAPANTN